MTPTGHEEEGEDQGIIHTSQLITGSSRRTTLDDQADQESNVVLRGHKGEVWAHSGAGKGTAAPWIAKRVAVWAEWLGSQTVALKCDNEPAHSRSCPGDSEAEERRQHHHLRAS